MFGLLNINKPVGPTSHDVVARIRRLLPRHTRVGHTGTLDPFASGVLVVCVGQATRLAEYVGELPKQYEAEVTFGATSTTDDSQGELTATGAPMPSEEQVRQALPGFVGVIEQTPPIYSAVLIGGQRAYKLARAQKEVAMPARQVRIDAVELLHMEAGRARIRVDCGGGTYIRAIARDLGHRLGCGAYCSLLIRTRVGPFTLGETAALDDLRSEAIGSHLLPARLAVADWPAVTLTPDEQAQLPFGRPIAWTSQGDPLPANAAALDEQGKLLALCHGDIHSGTLHPFKVFVGKD